MSFPDNEEESCRFLSFASCLADIPHADHAARRFARRAKREREAIGQEWEILFRSVSHTNFRRCTFTASAIVSLHAKLDYRP